ncbi:MAG: hypothetical protein KC489_13260, partial [Gemmatimonadetes bacterium]|nr:hypothetical protein [Gemmatimonadota bacterium]
MRPLTMRIDAARLARYLEERDPGLGQTLLTAVGTIALPIEQRSSPALARRLAAQATDRLGQLDDGAVVERPPMRRALWQLAALVVAAGVLLVLGPGEWRTLAFGLASPWTPIEEVVPPHRLAVEPGDVTVPRGSALDVVVVASGFAPEDALLFLQREGTTEWDALPMLADSAGAFSLRLFDLAESVTYRVEAGDARSAEHRITVTDLPAVQEISTHLEYPGYTGLPDELREGEGDIAAVIGTVVEVRPRLTMPVREAFLRFDDGRVIPLTVADSLAPIARFRIGETGFYAIDLVAPDGTRVPGTVRWSITALEDRPPVVRITDPGRDSRATNIEEVSVAAAADD